MAVHSDVSEHGVDGLVGHTVECLGYVVECVYRALVQEVEPALAHLNGVEDVCFSVHVSSKQNQRRKGTEKLTP